MISAKQTGRRRPHRGQQTRRFQCEPRRIPEIRRDVVDSRGIANGAWRAEDDEQQEKSEHRSREVQWEIDETILEANAARIYKAAHYEQMLEVFCEATGILPKAHQRAMLLRCVYGLSHKEIAKKKGVSISSVEKHKARAADWLVMLGRGDLTTEERTALARWLRKIQQTGRLSRMR